MLTNMIIWVTISIIAFILLFFVMFFVVSAMFLNSFARAKFIIKKEFKASFFNKNKQDKINFFYKNVNSIFNQYIHHIDSTTKAKIAEEFNISKTDAKKIKDTADSLNKRFLSKEIPFMTRKEVEDMMLESNSFSFFNNYLNSMKFFTDKGNVKYLDLIIENQNNELTEERLKRMFKSLYGININLNSEKSLRYAKLMTKKQDKSKKIQTNNYLKIMLANKFNLKNIITIFSNMNITKQA